VILPPVPVALTERWCPTCEEAYHGTVLTERRDDVTMSVSYSPCPKCGTEFCLRAEPDRPSAAAFAST
jgi:uncharacterized protein (UPF0212 family)